ncbi:hypothetical protein [Streptomyces sp. NRRL S-118]|uniref:hypothetical protein n=1 Tax=Streptomyces sp. NRRL S-118 TaxID=1463881 RepID=UPI000587C422|nr:hypothetical protein [Streptomyces sp. NRRL S-118]
MHPGPDTHLPPSRGCPRSLRLAYEAFHALHHTHYLAFARARLDDDRAHAAVAAAFTALLATWPAVISSLDPASRAWAVLTDQIRSRAGGCSPPDGDRPVEGRSAQGPSADEPPEDPLAEDLRTLAALGYSAEHSASLTGLPLGKVRYLTARTDRTS